MTIEELMASNSSLKLADTYQLLIELYKVYIKHKQSGETFDHFYFWGEAMLADFDSIDKYRINAKSLFQNLADQKELSGDFSFLDEEQIQLIQSFWQSFNPNLKDSIQQRFLEIWNVLYPVYADFKNSLRDKGIAYEGMISRRLVEDMEEGKISETFNGMFAFIGLNALNECEKSLLRFLKKQQKALFYWDYDKYYTTDVQQEAGQFIRKNIREFSPEKVKDSFQSFKLPKDIRAIASTGEVMQAKVAPLLLEELKSAQKDKAEEAARTAIVLSNENLLMPLLYALPDEDVNVTMGYPFSHTAVFSLSDLLIQLQRNSKTPKNGNVSFYHKDVQAVLSHPYIKGLTGSTSDSLLQNIVKNNRVYIGEKFFEQNSSVQQIFRGISDYTSMIDYLSAIFNQLVDIKLEDDTALRKEYIYYFLSSIHKLKKAINDEKLTIGLPVFLSLLHISLRNIRIPFTGEPLSGIQVMGVLETRALDFKNVIILSFSEGVFPAPISSASFIPHNLRKGFGLPVIEEHEAMYAYNFYRLVQRAKNVRLIYSARTDGSDIGEPSRYLYQLKMESEHTVKEETFSYSITIDKKEPIVIEKSKELLGKLESRATAGLSPSAISTYIACPLQFYFKYLLAIKEQDEVEEDVNMVLFGNILHHTIEKLYHPYLNKALGRETIYSLSRDTDRIKAAVNVSFAEVYYCSDSLPDDFEQNGRLSIIRDMVMRYVRGILKYDMTKTPFVLKMLENEIKLPYVFFTANGKQKEIYLKGILDRVDEVNGNMHIVDYKTGKNKREFKGVDALFSDSNDEQNGAVFQTFLYALMYEKENGTSKLVVPTLYFIRDMYGGDYSAKVIERKSRSVQEEVSDFSFYRNEFTQRFDRLLSDLFDAEQPFVQTNDTQICATRCPFKIICNR
jgi:CRISPR/Cas system-associated exonuclease Cas4 (RecB family)